MRNPNAPTLLSYFEEFGKINLSKSDKVLTVRLEFTELQKEALQQIYGLRDKAFDREVSIEFHKEFHHFLVENENYRPMPAYQSLIVCPLSTLNWIKLRHNFVEFKEAIPGPYIYLVGHLKGVPVYVDSNFKWSDRRIYVVAGNPTEPVIGKENTENSRTIYFRKPTELLIHGFDCPLDQSL